jgi:hypothetical protein
MMRPLILAALCLTLACGGPFQFADPCAGEWDEWYCQLRDCQPDPPDGVPEGAILSWPLDRRIKINQVEDVEFYDPAVYCLDPDPPCCPRDWWECQPPMDRCEVRGDGRP